MCSNPSGNNTIVLIFQGSCHEGIIDMELLAQIGACLFIYDYLFHFLEQKILSKALLKATGLKQSVRFTQKQRAAIR